MQTLKPNLALVDFRKVLALEPHNTLAKSQMEETKKLIRKTEFEKVRILAQSQEIYLIFVYLGE